MSSPSVNQQAVALANADFTDERTALFADVSLRGQQRRFAYQELVEKWLGELFVLANPRNLPVALGAVGALARKELAPASDLDLVLLGQSSHTSEVADALWYPIWDSGIRLDHSVRTADQAIAIARSDLKAGIGLLDLRHLAGDEALTVGVHKQALDLWRSKARKVLPDLKAMGEHRSQTLGDVAWLLEPDLKDSYGGLREFTVLRAVAASWIADIPRGDTADALAHLLDVRDELHLVTGRATDRLVLQEQAAIAERMGYEQADDLLRSVCLTGRTISYAMDAMWQRVERDQAPRRTSGLLGKAQRTAVRTPLAEGVVEFDGEVHLARDADLDDPVLGLRVAAAAAQGGLRIAPATLERVSQAVVELPQPWPRDAREELVSFLGAGPQALAVWEALDHAGLWSRWMPGWERLRALPQHNPVHIYTVDRHLIEAAIQAAALTRQVHRPDLLMIGALLHDVGKGLPGDHTDQGMQLIASIGPALGFDEADTAILIQLCQHHLLLPETATRRDLDDPATVASVVQALDNSDVDRPELLNLVAALTEADAKATGPAAWSQWRADLIRELVQRTHQALRGEAHESDPTLTSEQLDLLERGWGSAGINVEVTKHQSAWRVTVIAQDRPGLMADVAGVLSMNRLAVRAATLRTDRHRALQVWTVQPTFGDAPGAERLRADLVGVFDERIDLQARLAQREAAYAKPTLVVAPARIDEVVDASQRANVIEVRSHDGPALLHRIGLAFAQSGVAVQSAQVSTMGSEAVDVFYITDAQGNKLDQSSVDHVVESLESALVAVN